MIDVILTQPVPKLGEKNSVVHVKDGYGNFLIAQGKAVLGSVTHKKNLAETLRQAEQKQEKIRLEKEKLAQRLARIVLVFTEKADQDGKLFGTITPSKLAQAYQAHDITIDPKHISLTQPPIKTLGMHQATLTLHKDLTQTVHFQVK